MRPDRITRLSLRVACLRRDIATAESLALERAYNPDRSRHLERLAEELEAAEAQLAASAGAGRGGG